MCSNKISCQLSLFARCLLWTNGLLDQDATWYGGRHLPRTHCVRWGPSSPIKMAQSQIFGPCLSWPNGWMDRPNGWMDQYATWCGTEVGLVPGHTVLDGDPPHKWAQAPSNLRPMSVVAKRMDGSRCHLVWR